MYTIERFSYREQQQQFREACEWLRNLGVRLTATRVDEYSKYLSAILDHYEKGTIDALLEKYRFPVLLNAMVEAAEIVDIYAGLRSVNQPELLTKLKEFVGGAAILSDETTKGSHARDIGFELSMAAAAAKCELPVALTPPSDVSIQLEAQAFAVECKRPFTKKKVPNRIRKGLRQLVRRYDASDQPDRIRGMLAVSISKTENDGSYFLKARNAADLETQINGIFDRFRTAYERYWQSGADPRTLATVFELRAPCILDDPSLLIVSRHYTFAVMCDRYSEDRKLVDLIAKPFGALKRGDG